jgi:hypothetical protein
LFRFNTCQLLYAKRAALWLWLFMTPFPHIATTDDGGAGPVALADVRVDADETFSAAPALFAELLSGRRELAKGHVEKLSQRFNISPELFFANRRRRRHY